FPADAMQRTNVQDIAHETLRDFAAVFVQDLHIEGGDYDIQGPNSIGISGQLISDAGANKIRSHLESQGSASLAQTIDVTAGTLTLTDGFADLTSHSGRHLAKTGAGTLAISSLIGPGPDDAFHPGFGIFEVQAGLGSMEAG